MKMSAKLNRLKRNKIKNDRKQMSESSFFMLVFCGEIKAHEISCHISMIVVKRQLVRRDFFVHCVGVKRHRIDQSQKAGARVVSTILDTLQKHTMKRGNDETKRLKKNKRRRNKTLKSLALVFRFRRRFVCAMPVISQCT